MHKRTAWNDYTDYIVPIIEKIHLASELVLDDIQFFPSKNCSVGQGLHQTECINSFTFLHIYQYNPIIEITTAYKLLPSNYRKIQILGICSNCFISFASTNHRVAMSLDLRNSHQVKQMEFVCNSRKNVSNRFITWMSVALYAYYRIHDHFWADRNLTMTHLHELFLRCSHMDMKYELGPVNSELSNNPL